MNKKSVIDSIFSENSNFTSPRQAAMMASLLDEVSKGIYSEGHRFVYELIQNADDSACGDGNNISFNFTSTHLIISHNGKAFDESDVRSITSAGDSGKKSDPTKTGYKGVGFKSVFAHSENVTIFSDGFGFRFQREFHKDKLPWQVIPIWTEISEFHGDIQSQLQIHNYNVVTVIELTDPFSVLNHLTELLKNPQILLFLRRVSKISVLKYGKQEFVAEKRLENKTDAYLQLSLLKNDIVVSTWISKSFENIPVDENVKLKLTKDDPAKLREADFTEISFAAKISDGKIIELKGEESLIFTYLPTKVIEFGFPFLVNGNLITNTPREAIHQDRPWNQWLFSLFGQKIVDWIEQLSTSKYAFDIAYLLPAHFHSSTNQLKVFFFNSFTSYVKSKDFILNSGLILKRPGDLIIDETGLFEQSFIPHATLISFINLKLGKQYSEQSFIHPELKEKNKLVNVGVYKFSLENLEEFFLSENFKQTHTQAENFKLIKYFHQKSEEQVYKDREWSIHLQNVSFIYSKDGKLRAPILLRFPSVILQDEEEVVTNLSSEVHPIVNEEIEKDIPIKNWLERLGIKESGNVLEPLINDIENKINSDNYHVVTRYLFTQYKKGIFSDSHYSKLKCLKLFTKTSEFVKANECTLPNEYAPEVSLEDYFPSLKYVTSTYIMKGDSLHDWNSFLVNIGVCDTIKWEQVELDFFQLQSEASPLVPYFEKERYYNYKSIAGNSYKNLFSRYNVNRISRIQDTLSYDFSKFFWKFVFSKDLNVLNGKDYGRCSYFNRLERLTILPFNQWMVTQLPIIPTTLGNCQVANSVYLNEKEIIDLAGNYLPVFDYDQPIPDQWIETLQLKTKLEIEDCLFLLTSIEEEHKEGKKVKAAKRKNIGNIYNKLNSLLPNATKAKKQLIRDWSVKGRLLSSVGSFAFTSELKWIKIEGFDNLQSENFKLLEFPETCRIDSENLPELLSLFNVQVITEFSPNASDQRIDPSFKKKFASILPYLVALIEKKRLGESNSEFERIYKIVDSIEFVSCSDIKLSFSYESETFEGPSFPVYRSESIFYYIGNWKNPLTMFAFLPQFIKLIDVSKVYGELRLLLELDEDKDIRQWLLTQGINLSIIFSKREFKPTQLLLQFKSLSPSKELLVKTEPLSTSGNDVIVTLDQIQENFTPKVEPFKAGGIFMRSNNRTSSFDNSRTVISKEIQVESKTYSDIESNKVREEVGRWCEDYIFHKFWKQSEFDEVVWENKDRESGKPWDFKLIKDGIVKFVDVKGTPSSEKTIIYLSVSEWKFMLEKMDAYSIFRVYNAGSQEPLVVEFNNPAQDVKSGRLLPNPITLDLL